MIHCKLNIPKQQQAGFTLVETLIALLIMGVTTAAMLVLIGQNTRFSADAETRVMAGIVAENIMVEALANPVPLDRETIKDTIQLAGRSWAYERVVEDTSLEAMILITVRVRVEGLAQVRSEISTLKSEQQF